MLYLDAPIDLEGLTLYRDYNAANRYYYMPRSPRLTVEGGQPMFQLLIFRRDITDNPAFRAGDRPGGGFLTMTVDLGVPQTTLDTVKQKLRSQTGMDVELAGVPFESGNVRVSALGTAAGTAPALEGGEPAPAAADTGPRFVERIIGSARSSLSADNRAVFTIELSHEGAQLMRASLEDDGASQVAVIYDMTYRGLMPAYEAKITIDFKQSYSYLRTRLQVNTLWFKSDIDAEVERLMREGHIKIEEADYLGSDPAGRAERAKKLTDLAKELATFSFFRPGLSPGKVLAENRGELQAADPTTAAEAVTAGFSTPLQLALTGAGRVGPGASVVPGNSGRAGGIGGHDPEQGAENATAPDTPATTGVAERPMTAVERWNAAGRPQATFMVKSLSQEEQQLITFDLRQVAATIRPAAPQGAIRLVAGASQLRGRIKMVSLDDPFWERVKGSVTSTADFESAGVSSMQVKVRYGVRPDGSAPKDAAEFVLTRAGDKGEYDFFMDSRFSVDIEYQVIVNFKAGFAIGDTASQVTSPWIRTSTRNLDIDPRSIGAVFPLNVVVGQSDWNAVQSIQSVITYDDPASGIRGERTALLAKGKETAVVPIRPRDPVRRRVKVATKWFYAAAQETVTEEVDALAPLVLNQPVSKAVPVAISAVDPLARLSKVSVELAYTPTAGAEQTGMVDLVGQSASTTWTFFRAAAQDAPKYRYRSTLFGKDGTVTTGNWQDTIERQLIVGDRFEGMLQVEVRFIGGAAGDLTASGFQGCLLTLEYPDAPAGVDGVHQQFFTGAPQPLIWRVPVQAGRPRKYRHEARFVKADGTEVVKSGESKDEVLLLILPPRV